MLKYFPYFKGINGNNAAGVIGRNKWQSPRVYYMQFEGKLKYEFSPEAQRTVNMKNSIVERFEKDENKHVYVNEIPFYTHPKYKYIKAYVDYLIKDENAILIAKTTKKEMAYEWEDKKIPEADFVKAQHNMALCDANMAYIAVYIKDTNYEYREIERNDAAIREIIAAEVDFYENNLLKRNPPMFRGDPLETKAVQALQHEDQIIHEVIELDDEVDKIASEREEHRVKESDGKRNKERRNNELKIRMGRNEIAYTKNFKITYKFRDKHKFEKKRLFKDHPELEEKYTRIERERCLYIKRR